MDCGKHTNTSTYYTVMAKQKLSPVTMETDGLTQSDL